MALSNQHPSQFFFQHIVFCVLIMLGGFEYGNAVTLQEITIVGSSSRKNTALNAINATGIDKKQYQSISSLVNMAPSAQINKVGGIKTLSLRGMSQGRNLVIYDNIQLNDPSALNNEPDLTHVDTQDIELSKIITGAEALYYGNGAIGGVLLLTSKNAAPGMQASGHIEAGNYRSLNTRAQASHHANDHNFFVSVNQRCTGKGTLWNRQQHVAMSDYRTKLNFLAKAQFLLHKNFSVMGLARYSNTKNFFNAYDPVRSLYFENGNRSRNNLGSCSIGSQYTALSGRWVHRIFYLYQENNRAYEGSFADRFKGYTQKTFYESDHHFNAKFSTQYGVEVARNSLRSRPNIKKSLYNAGGKLKLIYKPITPTRLFLSGRIDKYQTLRRYTTVQAGVKHQMTSSITLLGSIGTGFKVPGLFTHVEAPFYKPNPHLKPEQARVWDGGFENHFFQNRLRTKLLYYAIVLRDAITYDALQQTLVNKNKRISKGIEFSATALPTDNLEVATSVTAAKTKDYYPGTWAYKSPRYKIGLSILYHFDGDHSAFVEVIHNTRQKHWPGVTLPSTTNTRMGVNFNANKHITCYGRIENIMNQKRQENYLYARRGIEIYAGIRIKTL